MSGSRWLTPEEQLAWRAFLFANLLVFRDLDHQVRHDAHLSFDYYGMLARLSEAPDRSRRMSDLAVLTASSPSRLTHAIDHLEKLGWVIRRPCPIDRRVQHAVLTDAGYEVLQAAAPGHVDAVRETLFAALSPGQIASMSEIMGVIVRHLDPDVAAEIGLLDPDPMGTVR